MVQLPTDVAIALISAIVAAFGALFAWGKSWSDRWAAEVKLGTERAMNNPPTLVGEATTLPPPAFEEPVSVRKKRLQIEKRVILEQFVTAKSDPPPRYRLKSHHDI